MASLANDPGSRKRIQFIDSDGNRQAIRLGKMSKRQAQGVKLRIEDLVAAKHSGGTPNDETSRWLTTIDSTLRDRLVRKGLVTAVEPMHTLTLAKLVDEFKARPGWAEKKPGTQRNQDKCFRSLLEYFGDIPIDQLTEARADDFRSHLQLAKDKGGRGLALSTGNRHCAAAWTLYRFAIRSRHLDRNPFEDVPRGMPRTDCNAMVSVDDAQKVLVELPTTEWKLLFALSRWGGLRIPSEPRRLRWCDIDWEGNKFLVHCTKTEHHPGHETRWVPIFPELEPLLAQRFEEASEGDELVLPFMVGMADSTFATHVGRAVKRAGVKQWPRMFHSMRSTRQTELEHQHPSHVVCSWFGNSTEVARRHYLQVTEEDFTLAAKKVAQKPAQHTSAQSGMAMKTENDEVAKPL